MRKFLSIAIAVIVIALSFVVIANANEDVTTEPETTEATIEITEDDIVIPDGLNEDAETLWHKFWNAVISLINGTNARDAIVTLASIVGATIMILFKGAANTVLSRVTNISAKNTDKTNELVKGVNENSTSILALSNQLIELENKTESILATESARTEDGGVTKEGILALADMLMTTYQSSSTIPAAAKEVIRTKYLAVVKALDDGETKEA